MKLPVFFVFCLFVPGIICRLIWRKIEPVSSQNIARTDTVIGYDSKRDIVIMFGGKTENNGQIVLGDTWIYSFKTNRWEEVVTDSEPDERYGSVGGVSGDYFYISTGKGKHGVYHNDIWAFDLEKRIWKELPVQKQPNYYDKQQWDTKLRDDPAFSGPQLRHAGTGGIFPNASRFYLSQGLSQDAPSDTLSYSIVEKGWYVDYGNRGPYGKSYPHARYLQAGTMISQQELLIFGGCLSGGGSGGPCPAGDSWIFDGHTKTWTALDSCSFPRIRAGLAMLPIKNGERRVVLYGGTVETSQVVNKPVEIPNDQVAILNPDTKEWSLRQTEGEIPNARHSMAMVTVKSGILVFGGYDSDAQNLSREMYLLEGDGATADQAPRQAACNPTFFSLVMLHGILMALGWGFFLQWGAFIARYARRQSRVWLHSHRLFQGFGLLLTIAGFICGIISVQGQHFRLAHSIIGIVVMILGIIQPFTAFFQPRSSKDGENKDVPALLWEFFHSFIGRSGLMLALANISIGVFLALSHIIVWILWFAYLGVLLLIHIVAEVCKNYTKRVNTDEHDLPSRQEKYIIKNSSVSTASKYDVEKNIFDNEAIEK